MTVGLETQIRDYAKDVHETEMPLTLAEITEMRLGADKVQPIGGRQPSAASRPRLTWLAAVAGAAAVLVLIGGVAWLSSADESTGSVTDSAPSVTLAGDWTRVPHDEAVFGGTGNQWVESVTVGGQGLVAVGSDGSDAAVWTSVDGLTWNRVPDDEAVFGGSGTTAMLSVTVGAPGLVAVGYEGSRFGGSPQAAVWTSADGVTWSRVPLDESIFGGWMKGVTAGGPGLVAVGVEGSGAAVWTSVDGLNWSRVAQNIDIFGSPGGQGYGMTSVTAGGPGLVAVGSNVDVGGVAVWTSVDGIAWSRVPDETFSPTFSPEGFMWSVTAGGPGLVAVGFDGPNAAVWTSADGITWSQIPHDEEVFGGPGDSLMSMNSVATSGKGLVAVGLAGHGVPLSGPGGSNRQQPGYGSLLSASAAVWTSADGITWSRVPHDDTVFGEADGRWTGITGVTGFGPGVVAVGADNPSLDVKAAIWIAAAED
jgi:hypothetical protein